MSGPRPRRVLPPTTTAAASALQSMGSGSLRDTAIAEAKERHSRSRSSRRGGSGSGSGSDFAISDDEALAAPSAQMQMQAPRLAAASRRGSDKGAPPLSPSLSHPRPDSLSAGARAARPAAASASASASAPIQRRASASLREHELEGARRRGDDAAERAADEHAAHKERALLQRAEQLEREADAASERLRRAQRRADGAESTTPPSRLRSRSRSHSHSRSRSRSRSRSPRFSAAPDRALRDHHRSASSSLSSRAAAAEAAASGRAKVADALGDLGIDATAAADAVARTQAQAQTQQARAKRRSSGSVSPPSPGSSRRHRDRAAAPPALPSARLIKNVSHLPRSVTGGMDHVASRRDRDNRDRDARSDSGSDSDRERQRRRAPSHKDKQRARPQRLQVADDAEERKYGPVSGRGSSNGTPRSARRRPPDSPSLSSLLRATSPDNEDARLDPLGTHHHAGVHALTTAARPQLVEFTRLSRDGTHLEHHVTTRAAHGTAHERTLAEMERVMREDKHFPDQLLDGGNGTASAFPLADPAAHRRHGGARAAAAAGDDPLLSNPLGDDLADLLAPTELDEAIRAGSRQSDVHADPLMDEAEAELERARPTSVFPTQQQKQRAAAGGLGLGVAPVLEPSERERTLLMQRTQVNPVMRSRGRKKERSASLTELERYAADLAAAAVADPDAPLLPPASPRPTPAASSPRDDGRDELQPPATPRTPPDYGIGARPLERAARIALEQQAHLHGQGPHSQQRPRGHPQPRPMRDLFDVSPRLGATASAARPVPMLNLNLAQTIPVGANAPLPTIGPIERPFAPQQQQTQQHEHKPSGGVFGSVVPGTTSAAFSVHSDAMCGLCADRPASMHCFDCNLSLCAGQFAKPASSSFDEDPSAPPRGVVEFGPNGIAIAPVPRASDAVAGATECGCHEAVHQEFVGHNVVALATLPSASQAAAAGRSDAKKLRAVSRANERAERASRADAQPNLVLVEPADPLELGPPAPPSPPRFFAMESHLAAGDELDKEAGVGMAHVRGLCALCQHCRGSVWCVDCGLLLCTSRRTVALPGAEPGLTTLVDAANDSTPDCDHALHAGAHAAHVRVPYDPTLHKPRYTVEALSAAGGAWLDARARGYTPGDAISPPPSLPPSNLPTPRPGVIAASAALAIGADRQSNPPPGTYNYTTGSFGPTCDICSAAEAVLWCPQCSFYLCVRNGCDHDVHAFQQRVEGAPHDGDGTGAASGARALSHHTRVAINKEGLMISPLPSARFTPTATPRSPTRRRSRSRSRSPRRPSSKKAPTARRPSSAKDKDDPAPSSARTPRKPRVMSEEEKEEAKRARAEAEASKQAASARRAAEEAQQRQIDMAELERRARQRQLDQSLDESEDDIVALQREARERARALSAADVGATPRSIRRNRDLQDHFDPTEVSPVPQCAECEENRADVYCFDCKKFLCAHALNYFDLQQQRSAAEANKTGNGAALPPATPRHHNNCVLHVHNLAGKRSHRTVDLPHHTEEKSRRRALKMRQHQEESAARRAESDALAAQAAEARAAMQAQSDAKARAAEQRKLDRIHAKQERLREREARLEAWRAEQRAEVEAARARARQEAEQERLAWLDAARQKIASLDAEHARDEAALAAELAERRRRHAQQVQMRDAAMGAEEARRWTAHREEVRRKRAIRDSNLEKQREWLERRQRADLLWRDRTRNEELAKAAAMLAVQAEERAKTQALEQKLGVKAHAIGEKVDAVARSNLDSKERAGAALQRASEAARIRKSDLLEMELDRRRAAKEAERAALERALAEAAVRRKENRERRAKEELRESAHEHRARVSELRDMVDSEERQKRSALRERSRAERNAERDARDHQDAQAALEAERRKLEELRARKRVREQAAKEKKQQRRGLGKIAEERSSVGDMGSDFSSVRSPSPLSFSTSASTVSGPRSRARPQPQPQPQRRPVRRPPVGHSQSSKATSSSSRSDISSTHTRTSASTKLSLSLRTGSSGDSSYTGTSASGTSRGGSEDSRTTFRPSSGLTSLAGDTARTDGDDDGRSWSSYGRGPGSSLYTDSELEGGGDEEQSMSVDDFLDSHPSSPRARREIKGRSRSQSRSRSRSRSGSRRGSHVGSSVLDSIESSDSDATADDLSVTGSALARHRSRGIRPAPRSSELVRHGNSNDQRRDHLSLDQLDERHEAGRLRGRTIENASVADSEEGGSGPAAVLRSQGQGSRRQHRVANGAELDPREVWALRMGASERGSVVSAKDDDAVSSVSFHSEYTDATVPTPRSDDPRELHGMEPARLWPGAGQDRRDNKRVREHFANEDAGVLPLTHSEHRAARRSSSNAARNFIAARTDPASLASQLLELVEHAPGVAPPLARVFRMLVSRWVSESSQKERDGQIVARAFQVLLDKMGGTGRSGSHGARLAQCWAELLRVRGGGGGGGGRDDSEASFALGRRRGEADPADDEGSYSARLDGATNLLVRPVEAVRPRREEEDRESSVMGPSRSVTGEASRDKQAPMSALQLRHLEEQRRLQSTVSDSAAARRRADRALHDEPFSDRSHRLDGSFDSAEGDESHAGEHGFQRDSYDSNASAAGFPVHYNYNDGNDVGSDVSTDRGSSRAPDSMASFQLGMDPRAQAAEDLRVRKLARKGKLLHSDLLAEGELADPRQRRRKGAGMGIGAEGMDGASSGSGSSSSDDDLDSDVSSLAHPRRPVGGGGSNGLSRPFKLPADSGALYGEDQWYLEWAAKQAALQEQKAVEEQDRYDAARNSTIAALRARDQPMPLPLEGAQAAPSATRQQQQQRQHGSSFSATDRLSLSEEQPGLGSSQPPLARMVRTLDGEVGGLQAAAGLRAQARPSTFLPHEVRQHQLRFGTQTIGAEPPLASLTSPPPPLRQQPQQHGARSFDRTLQQQMRASQQLDAARHLSSSPGAFNALLQSQSKLRAGAGAPAPRRVSAASASSASLAGVKSKRVRDALTKAHRAMGLDGPAGMEAAAAAAESQSPSTPSHLRTQLPAATHIDPSLAYLQQLRRREIHDN